MTYSFVKPDQGPSPAIDVDQIRENFAKFGTGFSANHTPMNDANQGSHDTIILELQTADPGVTEDLTVLYSKNVTSKVSTEPQLFVQIPKFLPTSADPTNALNTGMQLTYQQVNTAGPQYQSFLPGGYLIYFGTITGMTVPNVDISVQITLTPSPNEILSAIATPNTTRSDGSVMDVSTVVNTFNKFTITSRGNVSGVAIAYSFGWIAIARA